MQIRSVTFFIDPKLPPAHLDEAAAAVRHSFDFPLQTVRLATTPFPEWLQSSAQLSEFVDQSREWGADYISLGPVRLDDSSSELDRIAAVIAAHDVVFASAEIADRRWRLDTGRAREIAGLVQRLSGLQANGFANLYFTATANCPAGSPFFPVSYHGGGPTRFAIATEAADLAVTAFEAAGSLQEARENLVQAIEQAVSCLMPAAESLAAQYALEFGGIDFSLAPYPEQARSIGAAVEALGVGKAGRQGSLFAAALMAECVDRARFERCGFSGLMFPVLEDVVLADRAAEGILTVNDLLLYSAVCGAGLDTVPLPGATSVDELTAIYLDMAALALRLNKPLTARLMPLPGKDAGDSTEFDFSYFANSKVMAAKESGMAGLLAGAERIVVQPRVAR